MFSRLGLGRRVKIGLMIHFYDEVSGTLRRYMMK